MSTERSSSAVRKIRSIFETKESEREASEARARSGSRAASREGRSRPLSKVRSSFVNVERPSMASTAEQTDGGELERVSSASLRRQSFSENDENRESLEAFKKTVSQDNERRGRESSVQETIPEVAVESAVGTPALEIKESQALGVTPKSSSKLNTVSKADDTASTPTDTNKAIIDKEPEAARATAPAKPETSATEIPQKPKAEAESSAPVLETKPLSIQSNGTKQSSRPSNILPKKAPKPSVESPKSPASVKSATSSLAQSAKAAVKDLSRKVSRSSLTAPTAASNARASGAGKADASRASAPAKREPTKVANVSAHLLAPTAASRARREQEAQAKSNSDDRATKTNFKSSQARSTPRHSLASQPRPDSSSSQGAKKAAPDSGFLERMMRPTAASQSRVHEKVVENKPAPRKSVPIHRKAGQSASGPSAANSVADADNTSHSALIDVAEETSAEPSGTGAAAAVTQEPETAAEASKDDVATTTA